MAAEPPASGPGYRGARPADGGTWSLRLPFRRPLYPDNLFGHLAATAVPGVEEWRDGWYRRTLRLPGAGGVVALRPQRDHVACLLRLGDLSDLGEAVSRCRRLLDLDADPGRIDERLAADPHLAPLVAAAPGRRVPGTVDPNEFAVRAVLGQQISTAAARTHAARLVHAHGEEIDDPAGGLTHLFPDPAALSGLNPATLALPHARRRTLSTLISALASGDIDLSPDASRLEARRRLTALPGFGPMDRRDDRHAGSRRPGRVRGGRSRRRARRRAPRSATDAGGARDRQPGVAAVAGLRHPAPVGHRGARRESPARQNSGCAKFHTAAGQGRIRSGLHRENNAGG